MKLYQLITLSTLLISSFPCIGMQNNTTNERYLEIHTKADKQTTADMIRISGAWKNFDRNNRLKLSPEIYQQIQNQFKESPKKEKVLTFAQRENQLLLELAQITKEIDEELKIKQSLQQKITEQETQTTLFKEKVKKEKNARKRARQREKKQLQKTTISTPSMSAQKKQPKTTQEQSMVYRRLQARKTLFKQYGVRHETQLVKILDVICLEDKTDLFLKRINKSSSFSYCPSNKSLIIIVNDCEDESCESD